MTTDLAALQTPEGEAMHFTDIPTSDIPTDYLPRCAKALAVEPDMVANYLQHTRIGDPLGEAAATALAELDPELAQHYIEIGMDGTAPDALREAPEPLQEFFRAAAVEPDWLDDDAFRPGIRMFHRNSYTVLVAFVAGVLIEGFTTNIAKSFMLTGRVRDRGVRRLGQNNRHMTEIFFPGGLDRHADGWKLSVRIRLIHAQLRHLIDASGEWDAAAWGTPISAAHLGFAISAFSARLLKHMKSVGASYTDEEYASFMAVWRYTGYLMGIPETILYRDGAEALRLFDVGLLCEPPPGLESIAMANALINSAPIIAGADDPSERRQLTAYVYRVSRGLIGNEMADALKYPPARTLGAVRWFRWQVRLNALLDRLAPGRRQQNSFNRFGYLLAGSTFDPHKISYYLPDHVYSERARDW